MRGIPLAEIKAAAQLRLDGILARLAPGGRTAGGHYTVRNPTRADKHAGSFVVYLRGHMRGAFIEFADRDREKGDVLDLVSYLLCGGGDFKGKSQRTRALEWIADFCGLAAMAPAQREAVKVEAARFQRTAEQEAAALAEKRKRAQSMWAEAEMLGCARNPVGRRYVLARGIDLANIPNLESDLHFSSSFEYWLGAERDDAGRKVNSGPHFPAMIAAMRDLHGIVQAVHVTFAEAETDLAGIFGLRDPAVQGRYRPHAGRGFGFRRRPLRPLHHHRRDRGWAYRSAGVPRRISRVGGGRAVEHRQRAGAAVRRRLDGGQAKRLALAPRARPIRARQASAGAHRAACGRNRDVRHEQRPERFTAGEVVVA